MINRLVILASWILVILFGSAFMIPSLIVWIFTGKYNPCNLVFDWHYDFCEKMNNEK